jgi:dipeptidyl aminopeptidase/acylaminoacyl peptidase
MYISNRLAMKAFHYLIVTVGLVFVAAAQQQATRPLQLEDLFAIQRISEPAVSPDGKWVVYTLTTPILAENKNTTDLWIAPLSGGTPRQLTNDPAADRQAVWSPDGKWIAFESTRSGTSQIWIVSPDSGEAKQFTTLSTGASQAVWSPDGKWIAYVSEVFPEFSDKPFEEADRLNKQKLDEMQSSKVKARVITRLLYRHWDSWVEGKRKHIFVQPFAGPGVPTTPRNLTPGDRDAVPTSSTFSAGIDFAFSPDSKEIAYTATPVPVREEAWNTNHDIFLVPTSGGTPRQLTTNPAADGYPRYSPDGKYIAYRAQRTPGFEADRWELMLYDRATGKVRSLTENFDASVGSPVWSHDSKRIFFESEEHGREPIFVVSLAGNDVKKVFDRGVNRTLRLLPDRKRLLFAHERATRPVELHMVNLDGTNLTQVTRVNDQLFASLEIPEPESVWYEGEGGTKIQAWIHKPPKMEPGKKYPLVYLVHGGPQGAWLDAWHYRWNPAVWAAQGYVVMAPNPRGSTGFGQQFVNQISRDWGGKVFVDLMKGLDYACALPYVDSTRKAAAGASYGGYMMNWFLGHTGNRFNTIITHAGVYNFESMYGTTEEVWFDEWEHGIPWENREEFIKHSPHISAKNFRTPTLILHGERDYRVPISEAMQLFTTLQRQGVPSKFIWFPDEAHGILKPANSKFWHETVFEWLKAYLTPTESPQ